VVSAQNEKQAVQNSQPSISADLIFSGYAIRYLKACRVFHQFRQAKFDSGDLILSSRQFLQLPQLLQKMKPASKVVKIDSS
jgi:hypothetical protein